MTNSRFSTKIFSILAITALLVSGAAFAADHDDKWIHIKIDSKGGEHVTVNLPIALLSAAANMVPPELQSQISEEAEVAFDDLQMSWGDLRNFWDEVKDSPDATYVTVEDGDQKVEVKRQGNYLLVETAESRDGGADVNVRFPMAAVDALLSGPEGTLDFKAALEVLAREDEGHLVSVTSDDENIRIWIDNSNTVD